LDVTTGGKSDYLEDLVNDGVLRVDGKSLRRWETYLHKFKYTKRLSGRWVLISCEGHHIETDR
jgi:hypothetical protein